MSSPEAALQTMIKNLETQTGKSLDQWVKIAEASKLSKAREITNFLKAEHGLTFGYANLIALKTLKSDAGSANEDELISTQYAGAKAQLKPIMMHCWQPSRSLVMTWRCRQRKLT